ncbi:murein peptide amidase A [bacterium]|nr:murein peptide amidase A [bacterium]
MRKVLESAETALGNKIELIGNNQKDCPLIIGVFHGDEPQGKYLIDKYLDEAGDFNNLLFIPCLNPDGMKSNTRCNSNNVDLNRNFPTENWGRNEGENATCDDETTAYYGGKSPASEIETQFVINIIKKYAPSIIITLHAPYKVVNYDGPAENIAEQIAEIINYPAEGSIGYPTPGSFGTYCGVERNIPTITLELDEEIPVSDLYPPIKKIFTLLNN